jgi:hypothetical protein
MARECKDSRIMRGLIAISSIKVILRPLLKEVVYQYHASFVYNLPVWYWWAVKRYFQMHLHIADTTKNSVTQLEPFWHNLNEKCVYQGVVFITKEINNHN